MLDATNTRWFLMTAALLSALPAPAQQPDVISQHACYRTGYQTTPIHIRVDPQFRSITAMELRYDQLTERGGDAILTLDESEASLDEFGDATVVCSLPKYHLHVKLVPVVAADRFARGRRLYRLEFAEGLWRNRLFFVWSPSAIADNRLLIRDETPSMEFDPSDGTMYRHILPLEVSSKSVDPPVNQPLGDRISFHTHHFHTELFDRPSQPICVSIFGKLNGEVGLEIDYNLVSFRPIGDVAMSTLLFCGVQSYETKEHPIQDDSGRGRRIFNLVRKTKNNDDDKTVRPTIVFSLVLSPDMNGPHRLIIRKHGMVQHILPLYDSRWQRFMQDYLRLSRVSARESQAIDEIRELIGWRFYFRVKDNRVASLSLSGESVTDATLACLRNLSHLKSLELSSCRGISDVGFSPIKNLTELETLSLRFTPVSDQVLEYVSQLHRLRRLRISDEPSSELLFKDMPHITDEGLRFLAGLTDLQNLDLYGPGITDAGLEHLAKLTGLKRLSLIQARITPAGVAEFRERLPHCEIEH